MSEPDDKLISTSHPRCYVPTAEGGWRCLGCGQESRCACPPSEHGRGCGCFWCLPERPGVSAPPTWADMLRREREADEAAGREQR